MVFSKKFIFIFGILLILGILIPFKVFKNSRTIRQVQSEPSVHYHAGFVVFDNGKKVDFSDIQYMNIEPCTLHKADEKETPEHEQLEKAHLHDGVGDVVHSHREGAKWGDLFTNINYPLDYSQATAFVGGEEVVDIKNALITADSSLVIFIGTVNKSLLTQSVPLDHIKEVEKMSENCGGQS